MAFDWTKVDWRDTREVQRLADSVTLDELMLNIEKARQLIAGGHAAAFAAQIYLESGRLPAEKQRDIVTAQATSLQAGVKVVDRMKVLSAAYNKRQERIKGEAIARANKADPMELHEELKALEEKLAIDQSLESHYLQHNTHQALLARLAKAKPVPEVAGTKEEAVQRLEGQLKAVNADIKKFGQAKWTHEDGVDKLISYQLSQAALVRAEALKSHLDKRIEATRKSEMVHSQPGKGAFVLAQKRREK